MASKKGEMHPLDEDLSIERKGSSSKSSMLYIVAAILVIALVILVIGLYFGLKSDESDLPPRIPEEQRGGCKVDTEFQNFSVSTDTAVCSKIGCDILTKKGSAVDAAIAAMLCIGVVTMHSSGIGGGAFMLIYERQNRKATFVNARETAPGTAHKDVYVNNKNEAKYGPRSAGVPGELKGMIEAHKLYGKLEWAELVQPSIELASSGFNVTHALDLAIKKQKTKITDPDFRKLLTNEDGQFKKEGDKIVNAKLAATLKEIQENPESFYTGPLARKIAADFKNNGGNITEEDLRKYTTPVTPEVLRLNINGVTMLSCPPPSGGTVVTQIFNILQNFNFSSASVANVNRTILTYHRIIEAFKFAYARRPFLGDPDFVKDPKLNKTVKEALDTEFNKKLYKMIWDNSTHNIPYYGGYSYVEDEGSTSHLSVLGPNGDAVSVTSSVNYYFGGKFRSNVTGIIYNNEMDDFSTPGVNNGFGYRPAKNNFIAPGKRPLSSMSPTIFIDKKTGQVRLVVGAAGGSRIITGTALVSMFHLWMGEPINDAIARSRVHHQLMPNQVKIEARDGDRLQAEIIAGLKKKGHLVKLNATSIVQAVAYDQRERRVFAASDPRKGGKSWGI